MLSLPVGCLTPGKQDSWRTGPLAALPSKATANIPEFPRGNAMRVLKTLTPEPFHLWHILPTLRGTPCFLGSKRSPRGSGWLLSTLPHRCSFDVIQQSPIIDWNPDPLWKLLHDLQERLFCSLGGVFISKAAVTKYHQLGGLKQKKYIISWFRRLEVQNKGVCYTLSSQPLGEDSRVPLSLWLPQAFLSLLWPPPFPVHVSIQIFLCSHGPSWSHWIWCLSYSSMT